MSKFFNKLILEKRGFWSDKFILNLVGYKFFRNIIIDIETSVLNRSQYLDLDFLKSVQLKRLQDLVKYSYYNIEFWHDYFIRSNFEINFQNLSDFSRIPVVSKNLLKENKPQCINQKVYPKYEDSTYGSTGTPFKFFIDSGHILHSFSFCHRMFDWAGLKQADKIVRFAVRDRLGFARDYISLTSYLPEDLDKIAYKIVNFGQAQKLLLFSYGSGLLRLANLIKNRKLKLNLRSAIYSGEALLPHERQFLSETLNCPVFNCYACRDVGWLAQECENGGLHINPEWAYLEITDEHGTALPASKIGKIVVTAFDNRVMPFIRYETGDYGRILNKKCSCGRTLPLLELQGRNSETIILSDRKINLIEFGFVFEKLADFINEFQVVQESATKIIVNLVLKVLPSSFETGQLLSELKLFLGDNAEIEIRCLDKIPAYGEKRKIFISKICA